MSSMIKLPEKIRRTLEKIVKEMTVKENVYGLGMFGSWSRGDSTSTSDVDLLILTKSSIPDECVERVVVNDIMVDLDFIPMQWVQGLLPPELDQKIFETQILYDRDWTLANVKMLMAKSYGSPERVEIRTDAHAVEADIHLSRATSALSKKDFLSAHLFASTAIENILKIPLEITLQPISNSRFIENAEIATEKLGLKEIFTNYMETLKLDMADRVLAEEKLKLFKALWDEMSHLVKQNAQTIERAHFKIKTSLRYYFNPVFMQGTVLRTTSIINAKNFAESVHYLNNVFLNMLENYAWLKSVVERQQVDYTTLIRSMENLEKTSPRNYQSIVKFLGLNDTDEAKVKKIIEKAKRDIVKLRREKKHLIKTHIKS
ncbi:nucleotidyltransferase domain-containing protein [Candidatus Bathyarchaeota archaeon]|nr:nucleotidyltransferase domain-containing protein [Candidatus Bathyarchaeota archaeon]